MTRPSSEQLQKLKDDWIAAENQALDVFVEYERLKGRALAAKDAYRDAVRESERKTGA